MKNILLILGAGGHARVLADTALSTKQWYGVAFLDDRYPEMNSMNSWPVIGRISEAASYVTRYPEMALGLGVGYDSLRLELLDFVSQAGARFPAVIHPAATVSSLATVGDGSVIFAGGVININTRIGSACIVNTNASIDHDCLIGNGAHISPGALLAGAVTIGERVWVGMGAKILQCITVGHDAVIGAGAVVLSDIPQHCKAVGVPARIIS